MRLEIYSDLNGEHFNTMLVKLGHEMNDAVQPTGVTDLDANWARLALNETNLGLFKIRVLFILAQICRIRW